MNNRENIFPVFNKMLDKESRDSLLGQTGCVLWLTGLSGSGKTTLGLAFEKRMHEQGKLVRILDGDNIRSGINKDLDFTTEGRTENIRRIAEVAKLFADTGVITVCCFVCPTNNLRKLAREICAESVFHEVFINASLDTCETRDVKGLYSKARAGKIKNFTGVNDFFETPENPELTIQTDSIPLSDCISQLENYYYNNIQIKK